MYALVNEALRLGIRGRRATARPRKGDRAEIHCKLRDNETES